MDTQSTSEKIALITGANKSIGFKIARQIGRTGATVLLGARKKAPGEEASASLTAEGIAARFIVIDVTAEASIEAAAATITDDFGRLDILVNNAGVCTRSVNVAGVDFSASSDCSLSGMEPLGGPPIFDTPNLT